MSMFPKLLKLMKNASNTDLCGAVNAHCDNQCMECPFGSANNKKHIDNSLDMINLVMGESFRQNDAPIEEYDTHEPEEENDDNI